MLFIRLMLDFGHHFLITFRFAQVVFFENDGQSFFPLIFRPNRIQFVNAAVKITISRQFPILHLLVVDNEDEGIFWPQNSEYTKTTEMVRMIAETTGHKIWFTRLLNWGLYLLSPFVSLVNKAFGNLSYDKSLSEYPKGDYQKYSLKESIELTEK